MKGVLEDSSAPYAGKSYSVFLQGSYGNDTNIYADSDVDVVIATDAVFYSDLDRLSDEEKKGPIYVLDPNIRTVH
jgi:tRNA nucleotidyltransferase (CCA-adding enzyme)